MTSYAVIIAATDGNGGTISSNLNITTSQNSAPTAVVVTTTGITRDAATIEWSAATDEEGDLITYQITLDGAIVVDSQTTTTYNFENLNHNTQYAILVQAKDNMDGMTGTESSFMTLENGSPSSFTVTATADATDLGITINWEASTDPETDAVTYSIYNGTTLIAENLTTLEHVIEATTYNEDLTGKVVAIDAFGAETETPFTVTSSSYTNLIS